MTVSFSVARRDEVVDRNCCICLESFADAKLGEVVLHDGPLGKLHPMHKECIRKWMNGPSLSAVCPMCQGKVDKSSLFSWKERIVSVAKTSATIGVTIGAGIAISLVAANAPPIIGVVAARALRGTGVGAGVIYVGGVSTCITAYKLSQRFPILVGNNSELLKITSGVVSGAAGAAFGGFMGSHVGALAGRAVFGVFMGSYVGALAGLAVYCLRRNQE